MLSDGKTQSTYVQTAGVLGIGLEHLTGYHHGLRKTSLKQQTLSLVDQDVLVVDLFIKQHLDDGQSFFEPSEFNEAAAFDAECLD